VQALDKERKGWIPADTMRMLLTTKGTPFREKEIEGEAAHNRHRICLDAHTFCPQVS
jgi:hypothetical protein